jgi:hypothetical protein
MWFGIGAAAFLVGAASATVSSPMLDGACSEYENLKAARVMIDTDLTMQVYQDTDYVWLCIALPPQSFGTIDLQISSQGLPAPLNLHVSAQLGEWRADVPGDAPQTAASDKWWNISKWTANPLQFNGMAKTTTARSRTSATPVDAKFSLPSPVSGAAIGLSVLCSMMSATARAAFGNLCAFRHVSPTRSL